MWEHGSVGKEQPETMLGSSVGWGLAWLTHNQLPYFLPVDEAACFMHQGDADSPLDALRPMRPERRDSS